MSHELLEKDHMVSGNGQIPWHSLGTVVEGLLTAEDALIKAKLNWKVNKKTLQVAGGKAFKDLFATVRDDTGDPLGVVGKVYTPIQNNEGLDILDPVIGKDACYETAGSLRNGKIVWFLASLKKEYFLSGKTDAMKQYFLIFLSHDGTKPVSVRFVSTRVVCMNTLTCALGEAKPMVAIRHTKNYGEKVEQAHKLVGLADVYAREFQRVYAQLESTKMNEKQAGQFLEAFLPGDSTRLDNTRGRIFELFKSGIGNNGKTRADMVNGVTEFLTHYKAVRNGSSESRFEINTMGYGVDLQSRAVELLLN